MFFQITTSHYLLLFRYDFSAKTLDDGVNAMYAVAFDSSELKALGVTNAIVSPGFRSTPLVLSAKQVGLDVVVHLDERVAFHALGAQKRLVFLLSSSAAQVLLQRTIFLQLSKQTMLGDSDDYLYSGPTSRTSTMGRRSNNQSSRTLWKQCPMAL